jgi:Clp amino terminal domain, pathogenicity island component
MTTATENHVRISGWVTPRAETVLRRAIAIANDRGYNYLGVEHLALAIAEEPESLPARVWDKPLTIDGWHVAITENLPGLPVGTQCEPVTITVARSDPNGSNADAQ